MSITAAQTETSVNLKFMAYTLADQNELHVWDVNSAKSRCLSRLKPSDLSSAGGDLDPETRFTCIKFSPAQVSLLFSVHFARLPLNFGSIANTPLLLCRSTSLLSA